VLRFLLPILIFVSVVSFAQTIDDTVSYQLEDTVEIVRLEDEDSFYQGRPDSTVISERSFNEKQLQDLKDDPDMNYEQPPTIAETLWDRFWAWILDFLDSLFDKAIHTNWGQVILYILGIALIIILVMMILKVDAFRMISSAQSSGANLNGIHENIHEMNFDKLLSDATGQQDYRRGIRLLFLYALKILADRHLIQWESGKTNHEYVEELQHKDLRIGLNELSFYFDYAWYGNFHITADTFKKVENMFNQWRSNVR
jgi:hypothetical protein